MYSLHSNMDVVLCSVIFCFLLVFGNATPLVRESSEPKPCCFPKQFEADLGIIVGGVPYSIPMPFAAEGLARFAHDSLNKRAAYRGNFSVITSGKQSDQRAVVDYDKKTVYVITEDGNNCTMFPYPSEFTSNCMLDSAKYLGSYYYGHGASKLMARDYRLEYSTPGTNLNITISVSDKECYPIGEIIVGYTAGVSILETIGFANLELEIKDPSLFDLPPSCNNITMQGDESGFGSYTLV